MAITTTASTTQKNGTDAKCRKTAAVRKPSAPVPHLSVAQRVARGNAARQARQEVPRADHAPIVEFSKAYADQKESDYQELAAAVKSGKITAETGL